MMKTVKNFLYSSAYQLFTVIMPFITAPYISRVLGTNGVGIYSYTTAIATYFILLATLGSTGYGIREIAYVQNNKIKRSNVFWELNIFQLSTTIISLSVFIIFIVVNHKYTAYYLAQALSVLAITFDITWYFSGRENFKLITVRNFIIKILTVLSIFMFVRTKSDVLTYILLISGGTLLGNLSLWLTLKREVSLPNFEKLKIFRHLKPSLSFFIIIALTLFYSTVTKTLVGSLDSIVQAGFFSQSDNMVRIGFSVVNSLGLVMLPRIANQFAKGEITEVRKTLVMSFNIGNGISIALMFGMAGVALKFAPFFWGNSFAPVGIVLLVASPFIVIETWSTTFLGQYLLPLNRMKEAFISFGTGAVCSLLVAFITIPFFGAIGGAITVILSESVVALTSLFFIKKDFDLTLFFEGLWKYFLAGSAMFVIVFWMNQTFKMTAFQLVLQILIGMIIYVGLNIILKTQLWTMASSLLNKEAK